MSAEEIEHVYTLLIAAGYPPYHAAWMSASCPSVDAAERLIESDIAANTVRHYTEPRNES